MKRLCIYEPALCCETGLCGVNVDTELLRISAVINALQKAGVEIGRFNLNSAPMEFVKSDVVNRYVNEAGAAGLPVVTLDGEIVISGRYPSNEEILTLLGLSEDFLLPKSAPNGCCGNGCCQ
jgi:hypothetical protein